ncbi:formate C-acetyltransferase/glycerol dehydratase family glycyl radical enzyme [Lachnospiraceae bacterium oral taxon 500]|nr:formate C-acetyltransferase/glycerol dehydratase family glycyl radical enzyme [Lachnospiraceae bacterium oral taxon 500]
MAKDRVIFLKKYMMKQPRYLSCEQARIITEANRKHQGKTEILVRAWELREAMEKIAIEILPQELIVGNRSTGVKSGIVYPRCGLLWIDDELETLPERNQDPFKVDPEDIKVYRQEILPYWREKALERRIEQEAGEWSKALQAVVKVNQQGRSQGHIIPDVETWLKKGPAQLAREAAQKKEAAQTSEERDCYESMQIVLEGAVRFISRYEELARGLYEETKQQDYRQIADNCRNLARRPAAGFYEALQMTWFLLVLLHLEANAMSFSLGRMDQYLLPYYQKSIDTGELDAERAMELLECFYLKCNQIVCMCNHLEAQYFAGFPIGFNIVVGGGGDEKNRENELTFLFLKAQEELNLPQPNLSARLCRQSSDDYLRACADVLEQGGGLPQFFNDESIVPALMESGMTKQDAEEYGVVGCVELSSCGNMLGWSNAAMFNLVKVLELTLNHGRCLLSGEQLGLDLGGLDTYADYAAMEKALEAQMNYFIEQMIKLHEIVDRLHQKYLPTPLLSSVIKGCMETGRDVSAGGAKYNRSGIQLVQVANLIDSLSVLKNLVYSGEIGQDQMLGQLRDDWPDEVLRSRVMNYGEYYGNDKEEVDALAQKWVQKFREKLKDYKNTRNGGYTVGLYTVSAHVPMGTGVGASCDGRKAGTPLADGGISPRAGVDVHGPTAVLKSAAAVPSVQCANGTLLNMKFSKTMFSEKQNKERFLMLLRAFVYLPIHHVQFNVVDRQTLLSAQASPDEYRSLIIRVAGYSAYFVDLDHDLQNEIIARTENII